MEVCFFAQALVKSGFSAIFAPTDDGRKEVPTLEAEYAVTPKCKI